jgi:hypothetical protein
MNASNSLIIIFIVGILFSGCSNRSMTDAELRIVELESRAIEKEFELANLPFIATQLSNDDTVEFKTTVQNVSRSLKASYGFTFEKLEINCYVKSNLSSLVLANYTYAKGSIVKSTELPQHVLDTFDEVFKCYSPDYLKANPTKKSFLLKFDTLDRGIVFEVKELQ